MLFSVQAIDLHKLYLKDPTATQLKRQSNSDYLCYTQQHEGGIGLFGLPVLVIFEISFSVFALKFFSFGIHCGFWFFPFLIFRFWLFLIKNAFFFRVLLFACQITRPHHFSLVNPFWVTSSQNDSDVIRG